MDNFKYYIILLAIIIIGFLVVKRLAGCVIRTIVTLILVAVLAVLYYMYLM